MPLRTRQQDHAPTHQLTVIPSATTYLLTLTLAHDDQVKPPPPTTSSASFWDLTLPLRLRSRPHLRLAPCPTRRRQFER